MDFIGKILWNAPKGIYMQFSYFESIKLNLMNAIQVPDEVKIGIGNRPNHQHFNDMVPLQQTPFPHKISKITIQYNKDHVFGVKVFYKSSNGKEVKGESSLKFKPFKRIFTSLTKDHFNVADDDYISEVYGYADSVINQIGFATYKGHKKSYGPQKGAYFMYHFPQYTFVAARGSYDQFLDFIAFKVVRMPDNFVQKLCPSTTVIVNNVPYVEPGQQNSQSNSIGYQPPNQGYSYPTENGQPGYQPPNQGYQPPNQGYQPPNQGYQPPNQGYQPPNQGYQPPNQGYQPPPAQGYQPPPAQGQQQSKPNYQYQPPQNYSQPSPAYQPPPQQYQQQPNFSYQPPQSVTIVQQPGYQPPPQKQNSGLGVGLAVGAIAGLAIAENHHHHHHHHGHHGHHKHGHHH